MSVLAAHLEGEHETITQRIQDLSSLLQGMARLFCVARKPDRADWPYSWEPTNQSPFFPPNENGEIQVSVSTQAMCCSAVQPILVGNKRHNFLQPADSDSLAEALRAASTFLLTTLEAHLKAGRAMWESKTYGEEDVFTAAWLLEFYQECVSSGGTPTWSTALRQKLVGAISKAVIEADRVNVDRSLFPENKSNEAGPHALPLLRAVRAQRTIAVTSDLQALWPAHPTPAPRLVLEIAGVWFEKNLHRQMSFYQFNDFRFDGAELIFCLAGALETGLLRQTDPILVKVLELIRKAQERSVYWRPYRPMLSSPQGGVLLPLSIEVASALLQTLKVTDTFPIYKDTLANYLDWLVSQRVGDSGKEEPIGWHSENAYESSLIHLWDTALIMRFFLDYVDTLEAYGKAKILRISRFTVHRHAEIEQGLSDLVSFDEGYASQRVGLPGKSTYQLLEEQYVKNDPKTDRPKSYSLLLYGPPGVSKTTLSKAIAKQRNWDLIYLSPSDFITRGEAGIEEQAKTIFAALMALKDCVIVFDEIDRMILDRESKAYGDQGDMFQFMTPGMLTKLSELRRLKRSIFIIITNFVERIDRAIKRAGRIDRAVLCLPYDLQARAHELTKRIDMQFEVLTGRPTDPKPDWPAVLTESLREVARRMPLYVFEEVQRAVRDETAMITSPNLTDFREKAVERLRSSAFPPAEISPASYDGRFADTPFPQRPYKEYAGLLVVRGESASSDEHKERFRRLIEEWKAAKPDEFEEAWQTIAERAASYGLESWIK